jgi:hypothetical protein
MSQEDGDTEEVQSKLQIEVMETRIVATESVESRSRVVTVGSTDSQDMKTSVQTRALEVGQGPLSPTRLIECLATDDRQNDGKPETIEMEFVRRLVGRIVDDHTPSVVEMAQIRQAAFTAKVPLNLVDNFRNYVTVPDQDVDDYVNQAGSSLDWDNSFSINMMLMQRITWSRRIRR